MSKTLDEIMFDEMPDGWNGSLSSYVYVNAKRAIEQAVDELIGQDEPRPPVTRYKVNLTRSERTVITRNQLRAEQRTKLAEWLGKGK